MDSSENFNTDYYDECNFEQAYKFSEQTFTHSELCNMLQDGNITQKQIAALKFDTIKNPDDAELLLSNLTGCDGKIREAVAYKINKFLAEEPNIRKYFEPISAETFAKATIDINANICRLVVNSAQYLKSNKNFRDKYITDILSYTDEALNELDKFIFRDKKYLINKQLFKLYWCLEAIIYFQEFIDDNKLLNILDKCISQKEYTIREKCAEILVQTDKFTALTEALKNDENYYVRQVFTSSKHL